MPLDDHGPGRQRHVLAGHLLQFDFVQILEPVPGREDHDIAFGIKFHRTELDAEVVGRAKDCKVEFAGA